MAVAFDIFVLGISGCALIATGYIYWLEARRKRHAALNLSGVRVVEGLTIGSVTGIIIATLTFLVANRILPFDVKFAGTGRAVLEIWAFYLAWVATFAHAWLRPARAWREQCWVITAVALLAPILNWVTTGDDPVTAMSRGLLPVAGMDLLLIAVAVVSGMISLALQRRSTESMKRAKRSMVGGAE